MCCHVSSCSSCHHNKAVQALGIGGQTEMCGSWCLSLFGPDIYLISSIGIKQADLATSNVLQISLHAPKPLISLQPQSPPESNFRAGMILSFRWSSVISPSLQEATDTQKQGKLSQEGGRLCSALPHGAFEVQELHINHKQPPRQALCNNAQV